MSGNSLTLNLKRSKLIGRYMRYIYIYIKRNWFFKAFTREYGMFFLEHSSKTFLLKFVATTKLRLFFNFNGFACLWTIQKRVFYLKQCLIDFPSKKRIRNIIKTNLFKILLDFLRDICYKKNKIKIILFVYFKRFSNK